MSGPLIHLAGDTPRAALNHPVASHLAADRSSFARRKVLLAVLEILREDGPTTGVGINEVYPSWVVVGGPYFPKCAPDSPRKRLAEAVVEGFAEVTGHGWREEAIYALSEAGEELLERLGR